ncbi:MAG: YkgJ family cysteine cluster protein [Desulfobacterales bacterium]|nr:YkgJ family cysteine cluster protein [Desulfobacterales bacterium]
MEFLTGENSGCSGCGEMQSSCNFCGACCTGGGPVLRTQDERLIKMGKIQISDLYTMRKGERVFNKETLAMESIPSDQIKIKVQEETIRCTFLNEANRCRIYANRPFECRSYKCWDTKEIEEVYASDDPLTREDIVGGIEGLWDLVKDHQGRCDYETLSGLMERVEADQDKEAMASVCEMIAYDRSLRETLVASGRVKPEILDFLFGRALSTTIVMFNYRLEKGENGYQLVRVE